MASGQLPVRRADLPTATIHCCAEPLTAEHIKPRLLGHWGTTPGLNLIYAHAEPVHQRPQPRRDLRHRARATAARAGGGDAWLDGSYTETYPRITQDADGMRRLFRQFSFPGGIPSHVAPGDARLDPRRRRARLLPRARLRRRASTTPSWWCLRHRRRRGRDRAARGQLARQQVPRPGPGRRGAADPAPERLRRSPTRRCWPASPNPSSLSLLRGHGHEPLLVTGSDPARRSTSSSPRRWTPAWT